MSSDENRAIIPGAYGGYGITGYQHPTCESVIDEMEDYVERTEDDGVCRVVEDGDVKDIRAAMRKMVTDLNQDVTM